MRKSVLCIFLVIVVAASLDACVSHDFPDPECTTSYSFAEDVHPIIETKCAIAGCHNGDMGASLDWTDFEEFQRRASSGLVKFRVTNHIMPPPNSPAGPLSQEQIDAIACWSDQGALNN